MLCLFLNEKKNNNKNKQEFYLLESSVMQMNHIFNQVYYHCNIILILNINCRNMSEKWSQYWIITMYLLPISVQYLQFLSQDVSELCEGEVLRCNNKMWNQPSRWGGKNKSEIVDDAVFQLLIIAS